MKIYTYKLDDFLSGAQNKILITGIAGSGKTYNGKLLSKKLKCTFDDFDDFFYANIELKKSDRKAYLEKRKNFENDLFFSDRRAVVAGRSPILSNENKNEILKFPVILLDTNIFFATFRACFRNFKNIFKSKLYSNWKDELYFPIKGNIELHDFTILKDRYTTNEEIVFDSIYSLFEYIEK